MDLLWDMKEGWL